VLLYSCGMPTPRHLALAALLLLGASLPRTLQAQSNSPSRLRLEPFVGAGIGVPGLNSRSATGVLGGLQLGRAGGGRWSPTLMVGGAYAHKWWADPHAVTYDGAALFATLGVAREMGRARRLSLTGEYGVSAVNEIARNQPERYASRGYGERGFEARALGAVGAAYRAPIGHLMGLVHGRIFFVGRYGLPIPRQPQASLVVGVGRR
jgi:hypothetical protein